MCLKSAQHVLNAHIPPVDFPIPTKLSEEICDAVDEFARRLDRSVALRVQNMCGVSVSKPCDAIKATGLFSRHSDPLLVPQMQHVLASCSLAGLIVP